MFTKLAVLAVVSVAVVIGAPRWISDISFTPDQPTVPRPAPWSDAASRESLTVYYSPLTSTDVSRFVGFGTAYHMAIVYTDAAGLSYGASSGPSDLSAEQTPANALTALAAAAKGRTASSFGMLIADPHNNTPFRKDGPGDIYTRNDQGRAYPSAVVAHGQDLSAQWVAILRTYASLDAMHLAYSPISQNSNTVAAAALRKAGLSLQFSRTTPFAPGSFAQLPGS